LLVALQPLNHWLNARTLSGGERQRMALARVRRRRAGVDPGTDVLSDVIGTNPSHDARLPTQPIDWCGCRVLQYLLKYDEADQMISELEILSDLIGTIYDTRSTGPCGSTC